MGQNSLAEYLKINFDTKITMIFQGSPQFASQTERLIINKYLCLK